ncbi:MAG: hypothetical protein ACRDPF_27825, partial [Streptosporangiaceae bacterium]
PLCRELAVRLSGLAVRYPAPSQVPLPGQHSAPPGHPLAGQRAPDLDLRSTGSPATLFGLLTPARFVLLNLQAVTSTTSGAPALPGVLTTPASPDAPAASVGFADRLDTVTAVLARNYPEFAGIRALLIRPDGYIAWATAVDDPPPLARWLGRAR